MSAGSKSVLLELQYLPCLEYFVCLNEYDKIIIEAQEYYVKQTYRNRCYILAANKIDVLSIPVKSGNRKILIKDVQIDYNQKWLNNHWRGIISAYGKSPYFEHFVHEFEKVFFRKRKFLFDLNWDLLTICLKILRMNTEICFSDTYNTDTSSDVLDLRSVIHPKSRDKRLFYEPFVYNQIFGKDFAENLSVIDLIFCEGPNALTILENSKSFRSEQKQF
ncbi:WbqC family protein [Fulvivirgaceae bacterium BMA10]|uniref:WbqC family protein n=1 Tax=Splendidivirga corallicola TaxID=3051826 RepID=A0ABT8KIZ8_9BACT|nr:WbqC family protein [Fulvivirgaceae bacterium BMA10]